MNLDFLNQITVDSVAENPRSKGGGGGPRKERNPSGRAIRLFHDGSVFPSRELTDEFALEYAGLNVEHGYGMDVFSSKDYEVFKTPQPLILGSFVKKTEPKVDLFAQVNYKPANEGDAPADGDAPMFSVMDQGSKSFGKAQLLAMVEDVYGIKLSSEKGARKFVDLELVGNPADNGKPWNAGMNDKKVAFLPKLVSRGEQKGTATVQKRDNATLYVLIPREPIAAEQQAAEQEENEQNDNGATLNVDDTVAADKGLGD